MSPLTHGLNYHSACDTAVYSSFCACHVWHVIRFLLLLLCCAQVAQPTEYSHSKHFIGEVIFIGWRTIEECRSHLKRKHCRWTTVSAQCRTLTLLHSDTESLTQHYVHTAIFTLRFLPFATLHCILLRFASNTHCSVGDS